MGVMVALLMPGEVREVEIVINDRVDEVTSVGEVEYRIAGNICEELKFASLR